MADSVSVDILFVDIPGGEYELCCFPARDRNDQFFASADFRSAYATSPITGAGFKITPLGLTIPGKPNERYRHGRIAGYRVEANIPACMNGHNRFLVNGVAQATLIAVRLLRAWLVQNGCTRAGLAHIKGDNAVLCSVTLTFLYEYFSEEQARAALADFRAHSEAVMNAAKPKQGEKAKAYSYPPEPLDGKKPYTYTSYIRMREFKITAYVKERDQDNAFLLPIQDDDIEEEIQRRSERTLRVEVTVHGKWLKDNQLDTVDSWTNNPDAYKKVFALLRSTLRLDEELRTRRLKKSTIDRLKLSAREKKYLLYHLNGLNVAEHPDCMQMTSRQWSQAYSAARKHIQDVTEGVDLNIPYAEQMQKLKPALAGKLQFREYQPPAEWAGHVYSPASVPKLRVMLDHFVELALTAPDALPLGPLRDVWWDM